MSKYSSLPFTEKLLYENCASRLEHKIEESGKKAADILPSDPKMLSRILHTKTTTRNPFLIQDAVLFQLSKSLSLEKHDILWGTKEEIEIFMPCIFQSIMFDLLNTNFPLRNEVHNVLCCYLPYARYSAYRQLYIDIPENFIHLPIPDQTELFSCIEAKTDEAISFVFKKCKKEFSSSFLKFTKQTDSYSYWQNRMLDWINETVMPILLQYAPEKDSLETLIPKLIISEFKINSNAPKSSTRNHYTEEQLLLLFQATEQYISQLENVLYP